jgi:hypothetical protein
MNWDILNRADEKIQTEAKSKRSEKSDEHHLEAKLRYTKPPILAK